MSTVGECARGLQFGLNGGSLQGEGERWSKS